MNILDINRIEYFSSIDIYSSLDILLQPSSHSVSDYYYCTDRGTDVKNVHYKIPCKMLL